jgi:hypothetical protein
MALLAPRVQRRITRRIAIGNWLVRRELRWWAYCVTRFAPRLRRRVSRRLVRWNWAAERELRWWAYIVPRLRPRVERRVKRRLAVWNWLTKREGRWWEYRVYRRLREHPPLRAGAAVTMTVSGALAALYAFMVFVGEIDLGRSLTATLAAAALAVVWLLGVFNRARTGAFVITRRDRERRGF